MEKYTFEEEEYSIDELSLSKYTIEIKPKKLSGSEILELMNSLFMNQSEFAKMLGVSRSCVSKWLGDEFHPSANMLKKIDEHCLKKRF